MIENVVPIVIGLLLFGYLMYALLKPYIMGTPA